MQLRLSIADFAIVLLVCYVFTSCQSSAGKSQETITPETNGVCIWPKGSVRNAPADTAKWLASLYLSEKVLCTGKQKKDLLHNSQTYHQVVLDDGTMGWASAFVVLPNAKAAIALDKTIIYASPENTATQKGTLQRTDFVAIIQVQNCWAQIVTQRNANKGWVKVSLLTYRPEDVTTAISLLKIRECRDTTKLLAGYETLQNDSVTSVSVFYDDVKQLVMKLQFPELYRKDTEISLETPMIDEI